MKLDELPSLQELLGSASARRPLFIMTGRLTGQRWGLTYHAGDGVENPVVARALLEAGGAVVASLRRAHATDVSAAFLSWQSDPHYALLRRDFAGGAGWPAQAALLSAFARVRSLRDGPDVRGALGAFARHEDPEWRFRGVRVLPHQRALFAYAPDETALRALLRPLLLQVPDALLESRETPGETPQEKKGSDTPQPPSPPARRRVTRRP